MDQFDITRNASPELLRALQNINPHYSMDPPAHIARPIPEDKKSSIKRALELLLPLGLAAGGAYYGYKKLPELANAFTKTKGLNLKDVQSLTKQYGGDLGHFLQRELANFGPKGKII